MMKKSRWVALALAGILVCGTILTGCGDNGGNNDAGGQNNSSETGGQEIQRRTMGITVWRRRTESPMKL